MELATETKQKEKGICPRCGKVSGSLYYDDTDFVCRLCCGVSEPIACRLFEKGHENPEDANGTTAHVRDIKDRRWHPGEKRMFYKSKELPERTYFFPKD